MNNKFILGILTFVFFISCQQKKELARIHLLDLNQQKVDIDSLLQNACTVFIFYSPECPLSENYTLTANKLTEKYYQQGVNLIAVVPGSDFSLDEIRAFKNKYKLQFPLYLDRNKLLTNYFNATITPECFVLNNNKQLIYHGAIDNWAIDLGKKRTIVSEHYLDDAIYAALNYNTPNSSYVEAIGCFIE